MRKLIVLLLVAVMALTVGIASVSALGGGHHQPPDGCYFDWEWVDGHWEWTRYGKIWIRGHWDKELICPEPDPRPAPAAETSSGPAVPSYVVAHWPDMWQVENVVACAWTYQGHRVTDAYNNPLNTPIELRDRMVNGVLVPDQFMCRLPVVAPPVFADYTAYGVDANGNIITPAFNGWYGDNEFGQGESAHRG